MSKDLITAVVKCLNDGHNPLPLLADCDKAEAIKCVLAAILDRQCLMTISVVLDLLEKK